MTGEAGEPGALVAPDAPATHGRWLLAGLLFLALALVPLAGPSLGGGGYVVSLMTRVVALALAALSLDLLIGYAGLVSFGHAAFLGIGAYAVGILSAEGIDDGLVQLGAAIGVAILFALVTGAIALRTRGVYFIMITLAFGQMLFFLATSLAGYGGDDGMTLTGRSRLFGRDLLAGDTALYYAALAVLAAGYALMRRIVASRFGRVLTGARENETRMEAIGFAPFRYQLAAYGLAGAVAAVAGMLLANGSGFVSPAVMTWQRSADLIFMVVLGGAGSLAGAILGAAALILTEEVLAGFSEHWRILFGPLVILAVLFARGGLAGMFGEVRVTGPVLAVEHLRKSYGALRVTDDLSFTVEPGEFHAIIGPNGAGKTTLIHQLAGTARPDAGRILFSGRDITRVATPERVRAGLARSFQITTILPRFTALENVALAVQARSGSSFRIWRDASRDASLNEPAAELLERLGLGARAGIAAGLLSHGEKRQLELAIALATTPKLILLDEPLAGTSHEETRRIVALLDGLKGSLAILMVEHDMEAVFALADRVSVLVYGAVIATDRPAAIRADPQVRAAYLGEEAA